MDIDIRKLDIIHPDVRLARVSYISAAACLDAAGAAFQEEEKLMRYFNTEGRCMPGMHYMVRLDGRLEKIKRLFVDRGKYFVINRGRQYGKTTTLMALAEYLKAEYIALFIDFQKLGTAKFNDEAVFSQGFAKKVITAFHPIDMENKERLLGPLGDFVQECGNADLDELFIRLSRLCEDVPQRIVLIVDEADSASNYQVFADFLAQLRGYYLDRENSPIFHSVILAGVYDIKNLKLKIRPEENHQYNSPWNIAAKFNVDMSFSAEQVRQMLQEYEKDQQTGMDVCAVSECIYEYTCGYPYLVSAVCKILDEEIQGEEILGNQGGAASTCVWTRAGVAEAVKLLLQSNTPLFDSMAKQLDLFKDLRNMIEQILYYGRKILFSPGEKSISLGLMFGFLKEEGGYAVIANRMFEMYLLNLFMVQESVRSEMFLYGQGNKNQFVTDRGLNMELVLEKFVLHFTDIYGSNDEKFIETYGRKFFLLYLKPIINGTGNYYVEAQTRDAKRTDVVVDYLGEQFVVELKIWHGNEYNERGEKQPADYLDYFHQKKGYMISFNFNKKKETGVKTMTFGEKTIVEAVV